MNPSDYEERLSEMERKVTEIHAFIFGVENQGGLNRIVDTMNSEVKTLSHFRSKMTGVAAAVGVGGGVLGSKVSEVIFGP